LTPSCSVYVWSVKARYGGVDSRHEAPCASLACGVGRAGDRPRR